MIDPVLDQANLIIRKFSFFVRHSAWSSTTCDIGVESACGRISGNDVVGIRNDRRVGCNIKITYIGSSRTVTFRADRLKDLLTALKVASTVTGDGLGLGEGDAEGVGEGVIVGEGVTVGDGVTLGDGSGEGASGSVSSAPD